MPSTFRRQTWHTTKQCVQSCWEICLRITDFLLALITSYFNTRLYISQELKACGERTHRFSSYDSRRGKIADVFPRALPARHLQYNRLTCLIQHRIWSLLRGIKMEDTVSSPVVNIRCENCTWALRYENPTELQVSGTCSMAPSEGCRSQSLYSEGHKFPSSPHLFPHHSTGHAINPLTPNDL
jgi:hypothetical protein